MHKYQRKAIPNFPGYEIDTEGNVFNKKGQKLKPTKSNSYHTVTLYNSNKKQTHHLHQLIAKIFISNPDKKPCVLHKDGNSHNNNINNLYWGTYKDNALDAVRHGTAPGFLTKGENNGRAKLTKTQVLHIKKLYKQNLTYKQISSQYPVSAGTIGDIIRGTSWKHI